MKFLLILWLVAGIQALVGAQDPAFSDYYEYYDDVPVDGVALDGIPGQGEAVPGEEVVLGAEVPAVEEPVVTEIPTTTSTTTEGRRKLISLKSTKINRHRGESRHRTPKPSPVQETTTVSTAGTIGGRRFGGASSLRSGGLRNSRINIKPPVQEETETTPDTSSSSGPIRSRFRPSARNEPSPISADETQVSSTSRFQPRRSSFRPSTSSSSSDTEVEEITDTPAPSNRFKPSSRSSFRPSSNRFATEATTQAPEETTTHRFSTRRGGRGNSRGGSNFKPTRSFTPSSTVVEETTPVEEVPEEEETGSVSNIDPSRRGLRRNLSRKFLGPPIIRKTHHIRRPSRLPNTTPVPLTTTTVTTATTTTTTEADTISPTTTVTISENVPDNSSIHEDLTESVTLDIPLTDEQAGMDDAIMVEDTTKQKTEGLEDMVHGNRTTGMKDMNDKEMPPEIMEDTTKQKAEGLEDMVHGNGTTGMKDMIDKELPPEMRSTDDTTNMEIVSNIEDIMLLDKEAKAGEVNKMLQTSGMDQISENGEMMHEEKIINEDSHKKPRPQEPVVFRPILVRRTTAAPIRITTTSTVSSTEPPVTRASRRGSSRYSSPKPPSHPIVETTQSPSTDIFAPPLSNSVKSQTRTNSRSRERKTFSPQTDSHTFTNGPSGGVHQSADKETTSSRFRRPSYGQSEIQFQGGEVKITEIGTVEDTPIEEVHQILSGLGSRRRGLGRPQKGSPNGGSPTAKVTKSTTTTENIPVKGDDYDYYYYYDY